MSIRTALSSAAVVAAFSVAATVSAQQPVARSAHAHRAVVTPAQRTAMSTPASDTTHMASKAKSRKHHHKRSSNPSAKGGMKTMKHDTTTTTKRP